MSIVFNRESCFTASPKSAIAQLSFLLTRIFLDFKSLCEIAGFPLKHKMYNVTYMVTSSNVRYNWFTSQKTHITLAFRSKLFFLLEKARFLTEWLLLFMFK